MAYDPTVLSQIYKGAPNITGAMQDAYTLKNVIDTSQLNQMKLNEARQEQADTQTLKGILSKYDLSNPEQQSKAFSEAVKVNPAMGMKLQREFSQMQAGQAEKEAAQLGLWKQKHEIIDSAITPIYQYGQQLLEQWKQANPQAQLPPGQFPPEINAKLLPLVQQTAMQLKGQNLSSGQPVLNQEDLAQVQSLISGQDTMAGLTRLVQSSSTAREQLTKLEQGARETRREQTQERDTVVLRGDDGKPHRFIINKLTGERIKDLGEAEVPARPPSINVNMPSSEEALTYAQMVAEYKVPPPSARSPGAAKIMAKVRELNPDYSAARYDATKAEATTVAKREASTASAIEALNSKGGLYDQLLETAKKVDFGSSLFANQFALYKAGNVVSDPAIRDYLNALADTRAEFAAVLARGGQTTESTRAAAEHAFPDKMSYKELEVATQRSRKVADAIRRGNETVLDRLLNGESLERVAKAAEKPTSSSDRRVPPAETPSRSGDGAGPQKVSSDAEYDALPSGAVFIGPDGKQRRKP